MPGRAVGLAIRAYGELTTFAHILVGGKAYRAAQASMAVGIGYLIGPIDLIPARIPYFGHLDEIGILIGSFLVARKVAPAKATQWPSTPAAPGVLPNFFIVGAARCGTTSLYDALGRHPDVFCCPVKEPNHFCVYRNSRDWVIDSAKRRAVLLAPGAPRTGALPRVATTPDLATYKSLFSGWSGERAIGEASTAYLLSTDSAAEIAKAQPYARIIIVLREPVQRAQSEYLMHLQLGREKADLDAVITGRSDQLAGELQVLSSIVHGSLYAPQIKRFLDEFPRKNVLFLLFEDLVRDPSATLQTVFRHIGVSPQQAESVTLARENESRAVKSPRLNRLLAGTGLRDVILRILPKRLRRSLARRYYDTKQVTRPAIDPSLFRADILETEALIGRSLAHWLPPEA